MFFPAKEIRVPTSEKILVAPKLPISLMKKEKSKLIEQIKKAFAAGFTKDEIEEAMLRRGWTKEEIEKAFKEILA